MLIRLDQLSLAFGLQPLLDHASLQIEAGERVCLIGRNGEGKSSLLKIIDGQLEADSGELWRKPGLKVGRLEQELPQAVNDTVEHYLTQAMHTDAEEWYKQKLLDEVLSHLQLPADAKVNSLSGGWQRRVALAKALCREPELLLLDEPTNHLDIDAIQWLEAFLLQAKFAILFITHDRSLLQRLATRIIELDRGQLTSWPGDYDNYLRRREERLHAEAKHHQEFDKKLAQEEVWIRQGIKARRTRNEGRVRALEKLRLERAKRRELQKNAKMAINQGELSGKIVVECDNISHQFGDKIIIKNFSTTIMRGDKIGLVGANGIGKSTLIKLLLGEMPPTSGKINQGSKLEFAYFDQQRQGLDPEQTVMDNLAEGSLYVTIEGKQKHVISYLSDFLFSPERARTPVKALSGGECNRLLLAKLFSKSFNLLVMDEPTNDLDLETLELLEEILSQYQGTLLLVSHDRTFLNNITTSLLVFQGNGVIEEMIGDYHPNQASSALTPTKQKKEKPSKIGISFEERKELNNLPKKIEKLEAKKEQLHETISAADFYQQDAGKSQPILEALAQIEQQLESAYHRWHELEEKS